MRLNLDVVPFSKPAQSTPNAVLIYNHANCGTLLDVVQGIDSPTHSPRMVNDKNHFMQCPRAYEMQLCHFMLMPCHTYIYGCYMDNFIHALHPCIIWTIISINIQFSNKSHKSCQHIHTHIHTLHMSIH